MNNKNNKPALGSFQGVMNDQPGRTPSMVESAEYGMPMTEDANEMPMMQLSLNFNGSKANESMRSGVFGGMNDSQEEHSNPSF